MTVTSGLTHSNRAARTSLKLEARAAWTCDDVPGRRSGQPSTSGRSAGDGGRRDSQSPSAANLITSFEVPTVLLYEQRFKAESEAQRGKPKGTLESEIRIAMLLLGQRPPRHAEL